MKELRLAERGPHHAKYERVIEEIGPNGEVRQRVEPGYVELASGLHYWEDGQWKPTEETIEVFAGGAIARKGPHKVIFAHNLATLGAIDLETPDGLRLRSHVLGLVYQDTATGRSVIVAEVQDAKGAVLPPNQVIYRDAFKGVRADVRYTYTRAGFEQDVILREKLPHAPEDYGLDARTTRLVVLTEFEQPPTPGVRALSTKDGADVAVRFGQMEIGRGQAFEVQPGVGPRRRDIPVNKRWLEQDGRTLLLEEVPLPAVREALDKLPEQSAVEPVERTWTAGLTVPARPRPLGAGERRPLQTAAVAGPEPGFVLDYVLLNASVTNYTFQGDTTYYISGIVNLYGSTTLEGGAVLKFNPATPSGLRQQGGAITTLTGPYRPVVFTSRDDNSVGETLPGSSGNPVMRTDDNYFLRLHGVNASLAHLRFLYDSCPLTVHHGNVTFTDVQILHSAWPVYLHYGATVALDNFLAYDCPGEVFWLAGSSTTRVAQATLHQTGPLWYREGNSVLALTNSLLVNLGTINTTGLTTNSVVITNSANVFHTALGGLHYLPTNSPHRNAGTTNLPAAVLALLNRTTTDAPVVFTNGTLTQPTNFPVRVARDTNAPDLGYHYAPLDYIFGGCSFQTNATFAAGVAAGWFRTSSGWYHAGQGIHLADRQILTFAGTVEAPNWWVRANTVQERDTTGGYGPGGITGRADQYLEDVTLAPEVHATFLKCSMLANDGNHFRDDWGYLIVRANHSELWGTSAGGYLTSLYFTNCLIVRCHSAINEGFPGNEFIWRNVTMLGGQLWVEPSYLPIPLSLQDSVFDGTVIYSGGDPTNRDHRHNAYRTGASQLSPAGPGNVTVTNFHWQTGPLGCFYHGVTHLT
ncbi:MAG: hypothetical protein ACK45B_02270, partial [Limisphaerales bacterium]